MAPDLTEFKSLSGQSNKARCPVVHLELPDAERKVLDAALAEDDAEITNAGISRWLARRGQRVTWQAIRNHRNGSCRCKYG